MLVVIHNLLGQVVERLAEGELEMGYHQVIWSPTIASGIYFAVMRAEAVAPSEREFVSVRKVLFVK